MLMSTGLIPATYYLPSKHAFSQLFAAALTKKVSTTLTETCRPPSSRTNGRNPPSIFLIYLAVIFQSNQQLQLTKTILICLSEIRLWPSHHIQNKTQRYLKASLFKPTAVFTTWFTATRPDTRQSSPPLQQVAASSHAKILPSLMQTPTGYS